MSLIRPIAAVAAALALGAPVAARQAQPGEPLSVSAQNFEVFESEGRAIYTGNVNALRGGARLRADRVEIFFDPARNGQGIGEVTRLAAFGDVYYVSAEEVARGDRGDYDVRSEVITLTGEVVLTRGCNVSTGDRLVARIAEGYTELQGQAPANGESGRVRSVFFTDEEAQRPSEDCPLPPVPGGEPPSFEEFGEG